VRQQPADNDRLVPAPLTASTIFTVWAMYDIVRIAVMPNFNSILFREELFYLTATFSTVTAI